MMSMASAVVMRVAFLGIGGHLIAITIGMGRNRIRRRHFHACDTFRRMRNRAKSH